MVLNNNLQDMPQLVMEKILVFLSHKQLLALEQVSKKLNCVVDEHFSITNHLIIGTLPAIDKHNAIDLQNTKCLDGLRKVIKRCGKRLRIIQISVVDQFQSEPLENFILYFDHVFKSAEVGDMCPNIEHIITSPKILSFKEKIVFNQQNVALYQNATTTYANVLFKCSTGGTCKLRSISLHFDDFNNEDGYDEHAEDVGLSYWIVAEQQIERIVDFYPKLEQVVVFNQGNQKRFIRFLPRFIKNGLKDLKIVDAMNFENAEKLFDIGKNLRTLIVAVRLRNVNDVASLNQLQLPINVKLVIETFANAFSLLNERVCDSVISFNVNNVNDTFMTNLKNLQEFEIINLAQMKVIAEQSFPKLTQIGMHRNFTCCVNYYYNRNKSCFLNTYLPQLMTSKGKQLTIVKLNVCRFLDLTLNMLKHCESVVVVKLSYKNTNLGTTLIYEDIKSILDLPNLQHLSISTEFNWQSKDEESDPIRELLERASEGTHFKFQYRQYYNSREILLNRIFA